LANNLDNALTLVVPAFANYDLLREPKPKPEPEPAPEKATKEPVSVAELS
jgi:hypothetical protein